MNLVVIVNIKFKKIYNLKLYYNSAIILEQLNSKRNQNKIRE